MEFAKLRHRVTIQRRTAIQSPTTGAMEYTWNDIADVWGCVVASSVRDFITAQASNVKVTARITIRYRKISRRKTVFFSVEKSTALRGFFLTLIVDLNISRFRAQRGLRMADSIEFKLEGVDSLLGKLEAITTETKRKTGRSALRKAGNVIVTQIKRNAERLDDPHTARSIADNAALRWNGRMFKQTGDLAFRIGILQGAVLKKHPSTAKDAPTPHWRLLEFGTEKMAAKPLVRAAANSRLIEVFNTFSVNYEAGIDRAIKRAQKKGETA